MEEVIKFVLWAGSVFGLLWVSSLVGTAVSGGTPDSGRGFVAFFIAAMLFSWALGEAGWFEWLDGDSYDSGGSSYETLNECSHSRTC